MCTLDFVQFRGMVAEMAAVRRRQTLQPAGGKGDKIFSPTYPGEGKNAPPRHVYERRRLNGEEVWCALVDSVQSQANRLEEGLLHAIREGYVYIPHVVVDFSGSNLQGITEITSLDAPHRVYDAILRDSLLDSLPFIDSAVGQRLVLAKPAEASALIEASPNALLFGAWHSTGEGGGLGAKFARCLVSEIVAVDVPVDLDVDLKAARAGVEVRAPEPRTAGRRTGSRIDPLGILKDVRVYRSAANESDWTPYENKAVKDKAGDPVLYSRKKGDKAGKPSVINHGNVKPSVEPLGITCDYIEHTFVLSFAGLRRLRFGSPSKDNAGRTFLAALGLLAAAEQDARGYSLRSRCDLVCDGRAPYEVVKPDGTTSNVDVDRESALALYNDAFEAARTAGFKFQPVPVRLTPQEKLVEIVRRSQGLALSGEAGEEEGDE